MADYYPLIAKAVAGLDKSTGETRRALYDRARTALLAQLRDVVPALSEPDITRERLALEEAIRKVEGEVAFQRPPDGYGPRGARHSIAADDGDDRTEAEEARAAAPLSAAATARVPDGEARRDRWGAGGPPLSDSGLRSFRDGAGEAGPGDEGTVRTYPSADRDFRPVEPGPGQWMEDDGPPDGPDFQGQSPERGHLLPRLSSRDASRPPVPLVDPDDGRGGGLQSFPRIARPERTQPPERVMSERPLPSTWSSAPRNTNRIVAIAVIGFLALGIAGVGFWFGDDILSSIHGTAARPADQAAPADGAARGGKIAERAPSASSESTTAAQKVVLYEEDPANPNGTQFVGSAIWRTEQTAPAPGQRPEMVIRGDIEIPDQKVAVHLSLRRNDDKQLPASHTVEIVFNLPPDFPHGGIANIPGIMVKQGETNRGIALNGVAVKVTNNFFLVGLSSADAEMQRNVQLLKERTWFDIPIVYNDGKRALVAIEKGPPGEHAFAEAFAAWEQQP